eukprot:2921294-Prymnesium_polylepis.2
MPIGREAWRKQPRQPLPIQATPLTISETGVTRSDSFSSWQCHGGMHRNQPWRQRSMRRHPPAQDSWSRSKSIFRNQERAGEDGGTGPRNAAGVEVRWATGVRSQFRKLLGRVASYSQRHGRVPSSPVRKSTCIIDGSSRQPPRCPSRS